MAILAGLGTAFPLFAGILLYKHFSSSARIKQYKKRIENNEGQHVLDGLQNLAEKHYGSAEIHYLLSQANRQAGLLHRAIQELELASSLNETQRTMSRSQLAKELADCYRGTGDYRNAQGVLLLALKQSPLDFSLLVEVASIFIERGMPKHAVDYLDMALKIDPSNPDLLLQMSELQEQSGDLRKALAYAREVLRIKKDDLEACEKAARIYAGFGNYNHAEQFYRDAANIPGGMFVGLTGQAQCRLALGDIEGAKTLFENALQVPGAEGRKTLPVLYELGSICLRELKIEKGVQYLERLLNIDPNYRDARECLEEYSTFSSDKKLAAFTFCGNEQFLQIAGDILEKMNVLHHKYKIVKKRDFVFYAAIRNNDIRENVYIYFSRNLKPVSEWLMREIVSEIRILRMKQGMIISPGGYTKEAREYAASRPVRLLEREEIASLLKTAPIPDLESVIAAV